MRFHAFRRLAAFTLADRLFHLREHVGDSKSVPPFRLDCQSLEERIVPAKPLPFPVIHLGAGPGSTPVVRAVDAETGATIFERTVYEPTFTGGVRVATGDFTGDGYPDLVVAPGVGGGPRVRVLDGKTGVSIAGPIGDFYAFEPGFHGGVSLAAADVNGDGVPDVIAAAGQGGGPRVRVFSGTDGSVLADFFAYAPEFRGGAQVSAADFNGDGKADIAVGAGVGGSPNVRVFDAVTMAPMAGPLGGFFAFDPAERGGAQVGTDYLAGDVTGDGVPDLVVGEGAGMAPRVRVFSGADGTLAGEFLAYDEGMTAGVQVATAFVDDDEYADVVTAPLPGSADPRVRVFSGATGQLVGGPAGDFTLFGAFAGGVHLSAGNDPPAMAGFDSDTATVSEADGVATLGLHRDTANGALTVQITVTGGTATPWEDFDPVFTATFPDKSTVASISMPIRNDVYAESSAGETAIFRIRQGLNYLIGGRDAFAETTLTIEDDGDTLTPSPPPLPGTCEDPPALAPPTESVQGNLRYKIGVDDKGPFVDRSNPPWPSSDPGFAKATPLGPFYDPGLAATQQSVRNFVDLASSPAARAVGSLGKSASGVEWGTGTLSLVTNDIGTCDCTNISGISRTISNATALICGDGFTGPGSTINQLPRLTLSADGLIALLKTGDTARRLDRNATTGDFVSRFWEKLVLRPGTEADPTYTLYTPDGGQLEFDGFDTSVPPQRRGKFKRETTPAGIVTEVSWDDAERIDAIETRHVDERVEKYQFAYVPDDQPNAGRLLGVTLSENDVVVEAVAYAYYGTGDANGLPGDLKAATRTDADGAATGTKYYRYYIASGTVGFVHGLKMALGADSLRRALAAGLNPATASDGDLAAFADNRIEYDPTSHRVTKEVVQGSGCSICGAGLGTYAYAYLDSVNAPGVNSWQTRTTETRPDGSQAVVFTNAYGEVMLSVRRESGAGGTEQPTYLRYDAAGRVVLVAMPSAVIKYQEDKPDLMEYGGGNAAGLSDDQGQITRYTYGTSTEARGSESGSVEGYGSAITISHGELGTPVPQVAVDYLVRTVRDRRIYLPAHVTDYSGTNGTGTATTTYSYDWFDDSFGIRQQTITLPVVSAEPLGSGAAASTTVVYDADERPVWLKDQVGALTYYGYDELSGEVSRLVEDVNTESGSGFHDLPSGWKSSYPAQNLVTTILRDVRGRAIDVVDPLQRETVTLYDDPGLAVRQYVWDDVADAQVGPTTIARTDASGTYSETLTLAAVGGGVRPGADDAIDNMGQVQSLVRVGRNDAGQSVTQDDYYDFAGLTYTTGPLGTAGVNFLRTRQDYAFGGQPNRSVSPGGTIQRTVYDFLDRPVSRWVGTKDTKSTPGYQWSPASPAGMVKVWSAVYDVDGNTISVSEYPGPSSAPRVTVAAYDWRGRVVRVKEGSQASEAAGVHRPTTTCEYDNFGQVTKSQTYDSDGLGLAAALPASALRAEMHASYDSLGRAYLVQSYGVDAAGSVSTTPAETRTWFDARGMAIKVVGPDGLAEKTRYDALGRIVSQTQSDASGDANYADALTVTGDTVWAQTDYAYNADGEVTTATTRDRSNGATGTGSLVGLAARVTTTGFAYDALGRTTSVSDYGTDTKAGPRVTSYGYDAAGMESDVTDPLGHITHTAYDPLGRVTSVTAGYQLASTSVSVRPNPFFPRMIPSEFPFRRLPHGPASARPRTRTALAAAPATPTRQRARRPRVLPRQRSVRNRLPLLAPRDRTPRPRGRTAGFRAGRGRRSADGSPRHGHRHPPRRRAPRPGAGRVRPPTPRRRPRALGGPAVLTLPPSTRVFVATAPADMRRSFDGLLALVRAFVGDDDPLAGHLFVFRNKRGDRIKVLWWDRDGLALFYKRLEVGGFTFPAAGGARLEMTAADLQLVLQGIDPQTVPRAKRYRRPA